MIKLLIGREDQHAHAGVSGYAGRGSAPKMEPGFHGQPGDPAKMAAAMIASVEQEPAPKRLALGSDAYANIRKALTERLAELDRQKEITCSTDFPAS